jgi:SnoaL-like domain
MGEDVLGVIEQFFDRLVAGDWIGLGALLAPDMERIGPWGDQMVGRDRYVEMMATSNPTSTTGDKTGTTWEVHRIAYGRDGHSGFARVTAHPSQGPISEFEETLAFQMDDRGLVSIIEVFWQTPQHGSPKVMGST